MPEVKPMQSVVAGGNVRSTTPTLIEVRDFVASLVHEVCSIEPTFITDSARIDRELEMESVQMVQLQVALEQEYDITLDFLEILRLNDFGRIVEYIHRQVDRKGPS